MSYRRMQLSVAAMALLGAGSIFAQAPQKKAERAAETTKARVKDAVTDHDVTYGRIKEVTSGDKVVINVDNALDKTFSLHDKNVTVKMAKTLKVGDPVKIKEHEVAGKTTTVTITKHTGGGVAHGDPHPVTK